MKLRILGNSLRLRLSQTEVKAIGSGEKVIESTNFPNNIFSYELHTHSGGVEIVCDMVESKIIISVNENIAKTWAESNQVGIQSDVKLVPKVLIEKDFQCLTDRPHENEADLFPNPNENC